MTPPAKLRVRAVGDVLVPVYEALRSRRFIGRKYDETTGAWVLDGDGVAEVPNSVEYQLAISEGHLALVGDDKKPAKKGEVK